MGRPTENFEMMRGRCGVCKEACDMENDMGEWHSVSPLPASCHAC